MQSIIRERQDLVDELDRISKRIEETKSEKARKRLNDILRDKGQELQELEREIRFLLGWR